MFRIKCDQNQREAQEVCWWWCTQASGLSFNIPQILCYYLISSCWYKALRDANAGFPPKESHINHMAFLFISFAVVFLISLSAIEKLAFEAVRWWWCSVQPHQGFHHFSQILHDSLSHLNFMVIRMFSVKFQFPILRLSVSPQSKRYESA